MLMVDSIDRIIEDHSRGLDVSCFRQKNGQTQTPDVPLAQNLKCIDTSGWRAPEAQLDTAVPGDRQM
ncbi:hypothetical protein D3C72_2413490 [compost metagenome]